MKLPPLPLVVLDTETTGFVPKVHHVIEFASIRVEDGKIAEQYEQLFHTDEIPPHVEVLTRIKTEDIAQSPLFEEKRQEVMDHVPQNALLVGQNLGFDIGMLKGEGIDLSERAWIDTSMLASLVFPELESYSLGYLSAVLNLSHAHKHRAMGDVEATLGLLGKVWERLLELPPDLLEQAKAIAGKSTPGYRLLFDALPPSTKTERPTWLHPIVKKKGTVMAPKIALSIDPPKKGEVTLLEEPLEPSHLHELMRTAVADQKAVQWIAVKNLDATVRRLPEDLKSDDLRILYPPQLILDQSIADRFVEQETFTADEATLAIKLHWYKPTIRDDFPLHGGEEAVWNGRLACTEKSASYIDQYKNLPSALLLDHRQLLSIVANPNHIAYELPGKDAHVIIDDASMLEDTATKAYGWYCAIDDLRAAAEGHPLLSKITDIVQLWIEKLRHGQDLHYISPSDLQMPETRGLHEHIEEQLQAELPAQTARQLGALDHILEPENLANRLVWIEVRQNGSQTLQSVPERVGKFLDTYLYSRFPTTLLIPAFSADMLPEVLLPETHTHRAERSRMEPVSMHIQNGQPLDLLLGDLPAGKSIILLPSKGVIEDAYVKHMETLEQKGVTMICQGLSGGQGRMQAEFIAAKEPAVWLITPWTFEGIDLPPGTLDQMFIRTLPFDHPSHPVFSRRSQRYRDGFKEYSMPRVLHRLFRLLRTFARFQTKTAEVFMQDDRVHTKAYGKTVKEYLNHFAKESAANDSTSVAIVTPEPKKEEKTKKKDSGNQLSMF